MPATRTSRSDVQAMAAVYPFNIYATVHRIVQVCKQLLICHSMRTQCAHLNNATQPISSTDAYDENPKLCTAGKIVDRMRAA